MVTSRSTAILIPFWDRESPSLLMQTDIVLSLAATVAAELLSGQIFYKAKKSALQPLHSVVSLSWRLRNEGRFATGHKPEVTTPEKVARLYSEGIPE